MSAIDSCYDALLAIIQPLRDDLGHAKAHVASIENELAPLEEALKKLESGKRPKFKPVHKAGKPCARKQDVMEVCLALIEANQPIAKDDLVSLAKHKITEAGKFSLSGVSLRLSECLASKDFAIASDEMIRLSSTAGIEGDA